MSAPSDSALPQFPAALWLTHHVRHRHRWLARDRERATSLLHEHAGGHAARGEGGVEGHQRSELRRHGLRGLEHDDAGAVLQRGG